MRLVLGMGATGLSVARHLMSAGVSFAVTDSRDAPPKAAELAALADDVPCHFGALLSPLPLDEIAEAVVSPGISLDEPFLKKLREAGIPIVGDIELFARALRHPVPTPQSPVPVIAITGSNGKSTVTAWMAEVARAAGRCVAVGGNFGTPALDLLADDAEVYVVELSSFQLELTHSLAAHAAVVLNVSPDHIDRHGTIEYYAQLKARIYKHAATAVVNVDDPFVANMNTGYARVLKFGERSGAQFRLQGEANDTTLVHGETRLAADRLRLAGRHNALNALAVWALAETLDIDERHIVAGLEAFDGLPHRGQTVAEINGVRWVNDSKGTNLGALLASLAGMPGPVILLAGGQGKGADFTELGPVAADKTRAVIVFGQDGGRIAEAVREFTAVHTVTTLAQAVTLAAELCQPGDVVLLSPGCASLDQFENYARRGEAFAAAVQELAA